MKIPDAIQRELDRIPGRWELVEGRKHYHIRVDGRLVSILPKGTGKEACKREILNNRAQIRRVIAGRVV